MPLFKVKWDGIGFTSEESMTELSLSEAQAAEYSSQLRQAGELPLGIDCIFNATVSPDGDKEDGEWKVFVSVELVVEAPNLKSVERMPAPEAFLLTVAEKMVGEDADAAYGLRDSFEVLDVEPWGAPPAMPPETLEVPAV